MRLLALTVALAATAGALYLLASRAEPVPIQPGLPMDEIDDDSRARLEHVLSEAERQGGN